MTASSPRKKLLGGVRYILPVIAAALYVLVVLDAKYEEGWADAQGCNRNAGCVIGQFNSVEFAVLGALVIASFVLVQRRQPRWGNGVASLMAFLMGIYWISSRV